MDRRLVRTKRNIRKALLELTRKKSINDITITELAALADIDRKTFYLYYNTVLDVIIEMENEVANKVRGLLSDKENISIEQIFNGLNEIMGENFEFYRQIAGESSISYLKEQCKDILKQEITVAYFKESGLNEQEFMVYAEYCASGIIGIYTAWIANSKDITLNQLTSYASKAVEGAWKKIHGESNGI